MTKAKNANALAHPIEAAKWAEMREAERVQYGTAQPKRMDWRAGAPYTCPELRHRSTGPRHPSIIAGRRVGGAA